MKRQHLPTHAMPLCLYLCEGSPSEPRVHFRNTHAPLACLQKPMHRTMARTMAYILHNYKIDRYHKVASRNPNMIGSLDDISKLLKQWTSKSVTSSQNDY